MFGFGPPGIGVSVLVAVIAVEDSTDILINGTADCGAATVTSIDGLKPPVLSMTLACDVLVALNATV